MVPWAGISLSLSLSPHTSDTDVEATASKKMQILQYISNIFIISERKEPHSRESPLRSAHFCTGSLLKYRSAPNPLLSISTENWLFGKVNEHLHVCAAQIALSLRGSFGCLFGFALLFFFGGDMDIREFTCCRPCTIFIEMLSHFGSLFGWMLLWAFCLSAPVFVSLSFWRFFFSIFLLDEFFLFFFGCLSSFFC